MDTIEKISSFLFTGMAMSWIIGTVIFLIHLEEIAVY